MTCISDLLFENPLLITSVYKGAKATHRLLVLISQKNYHREQSLRVKDFLGGTGSMLENANSDNETNSKQSWENKFDLSDKIIPCAPKCLLNNQNFCSSKSYNVILLILIFLNIEM